MIIIYLSSKLSNKINDILLLPVYVMGKNPHKSNQNTNIFVQYICSETSGKKGSAITLNL